MRDRKIQPPGTGSGRTAQFVGELQQEVRALGGDPENTGSVAAAVHRGWIDLKSALGGGDHALLAASEAGEDYAVKEYKKALASFIERQK